MKLCKQLDEARQAQIDRGDHVRPIDEIRMNRQEKAKARETRQKDRQINRAARQTNRALNQAERDLRDIELDEAESFKEKRDIRSDYRKSKKDSRKALGATAIEQAYATLEKNPNVFVRLCAETLIQGTGLGSGDRMKDFYDASLNHTKQCGLLDFLLEAIQCLFGGLSLEEALLIMVTKALNAMGVENFGILFAGLPPDEQAKLDELVKNNLALAIESRNE
jgi:hypothetical protein